MKLIELKCPNCAANIQHDADKSKLTCEYCGYRALVEKTGSEPEEIKLIEEKSYAKAKGEYRDLAEKEKSTLVRKFVVFFIIVAIIVVGAIIVGTIEKYKMPLIDPFEHIEMKFFGTTGEGQAKLIVDESDPDINFTKIYYTIENNFNLSEGDTVTVTAESSEYRLTERMKKYKVEGLELFLLDISTVSDASLAAIHQKSLDSINDSVDTANRKKLERIETKPVKIYFVTDGDKNNILYDVFEVDFLLKDGSKATYYLVQEYHDIIIREGNNVSIKYGLTWSAGEFKRIHTDTQTLGYISAFQTLEEVKGYVLTKQDVEMSFQERDL